MPSLQVRDLPENVYYLLQKKALKEHRSLSQEAIVILAKALNTEDSFQSRRADLLKEICLNKKIESKLPDAIDLIREDRER